MRLSFCYFDFLAGWWIHVFRGFVQAAKRWSPDVTLHLLCITFAVGPSHSNGCFAAGEAVDIWLQLMFLIRWHDGIEHEKKNVSIDIRFSCLGTDPFSLNMIPWKIP